MGTTNLRLLLQGSAEHQISLLQLPHFDQDLLKKIGRQQVRTLQDLYCMPASERREVYAFGGTAIATDNDCTGYQERCLHAKVSLLRGTVLSCHHDTQYSDNRNVITTIGGRKHCILTAMILSRSDKLL